MAYSIDFSDELKNPKLGKILLDKLVGNMVTIGKLASTDFVLKESYVSAVPGQLPEKIGR